MRKAGRAIAFAAVVAALGTVGPREVMDPANAEPPGEVVVPAAAGPLQEIVITADPPPSEVAGAAEDGGDRLRVASFNILNVAATPTAALRPWKQRRQAVVATILSDRPDVIGVQEANPNPFRKHLLVSGDNQYFDLRNGLRQAGADYRLTNPYAYNCVESMRPRKCVHKARGASGSQRILYNGRRVSLVRQGAVMYAKQAGTLDPRYITWAVFRLKSNGATFLFVNTHLADKPEPVLVAQWRQLAAWVQDHAEGRPVAIVGDFNASNWNPEAKTLLPMMKRAGFGDVLNHQYKVLRSATVRARSIRDGGWIWSYNRGSRDVRTYSYHSARDVPGKGIDLIFASNSLPVSKYRVVLQFDPKTLQVQGNLPSDHNMVSADLSLPGS